MNCSGEYGGGEVVEFEEDVGGDDCECEECSHSQKIDRQLFVPRRTRRTRTEGPPSISKNSRDCFIIHQKLPQKSFINFNSGSKIFD